MTDPIPVSIARQALRRLIRECDAAESLAENFTRHRKNVGTQTFSGVFHYLTDAEFEFVMSARAATRGLAILALSWINGIFAMDSRSDIDEFFAARGLRALCDHYDRTAPGWREEKEE